MVIYVRDAHRRMEYSLRRPALKLRDQSSTAGSHGRAVAPFPWLNLPDTAAEEARGTEPHLPNRDACRAVRPATTLAVR